MSTGREIIKMQHNRGMFVTFSVTMAERGNSLFGKKGLVVVATQVWREVLRLDINQLPALMCKVIFACLFIYFSSLQYF